jgi:hypothetical protein
MAYEWGRFMWWLYHDSNAASVVQAFTAIAVAVLTAILILVTWWYARLTKKMARTMELQLTLGFQPNLAISCIPVESPFPGTSAVGALISISNRGEQPVKLDRILIARTDAPVDITLRDWLHRDQKGTLISPSASHSVTLQVPPPFIIAVNCTDLAGISKHRFVYYSADGRLEHFFGFYRPGWMARFRLSLLPPLLRLWQALNRVNKKLDSKVPPRQVPPS